ncbi:MAG: hypothetical protein U0521_22375 [Anaerolineae bacterium]
MNDGVSWDDARVCNFAVLPHTPLQTYTLRAQTTVAWADIRLEVNPGPPDGIPDLLLDNVAASYRPSLERAGDRVRQSASANGARRHQPGAQRDVRERGEQLDALGRPGRVGAGTRRCTPSSAAAGPAGASSRT